MVEEIYISVDADKYRAGKINILKCQAALLNSMKNLQKILIYSKQKNDLKKKLQQKINSLKTEVISTGKKLPEVEMPKELMREQKSVPEKKDYSKIDKIDEELILIHSKINELNNWL